MTTTVQDNAAESRFEIEVDGRLAGYVDYRRDGDEYALPHTRVYPEFGGQGIGSQLIMGTLDAIKERGGTVLPFCPFVPKVIRDHPEYLDLVPEAQRGAFDL
jgi:predicted GNAT family acetyltransferase